MNQPGRGHCHNLAFGQLERHKITAVAETPPCVSLPSNGPGHTGPPQARAYQFIVLFAESPMSAAQTRIKTCIFQARFFTALSNLLSVGPPGTAGRHEPRKSSWTAPFSFSSSETCRLGAAPAFVQGSALATQPGITSAAGKEAGSKI